MASLIYRPSPIQLSQLDGFLCPRALAIISIPLARRRTAASTMHAAYAAGGLKALSTSNNAGAVKLLQQLQ